MRKLMILLLLAVVGFTSCDNLLGPKSNSEEKKEFKLTSSAFEEGQPIPAKYTAMGDNTTPPLEWGDAPEGTDTLVVFMYDKDFPSVRHWLVAGIDSKVTGFPEGKGEKLEENLPVAPKQSDYPTYNDYTTAQNQWYVDNILPLPTEENPFISFFGPMPDAPPEVHTYEYSVYAIKGGFDYAKWHTMTFQNTKDDLLEVLGEANIIGSTTLTGTYQLPDDF